MPTTRWPALPANWPLPDDGTASGGSALLAAGTFASFTFVQAAATVFRGFGFSGGASAASVVSLGVSSVVV